jgi:hypothetical protein
MHVGKGGIDEIGRIVQLDARTSSIPEIQRSLVVRGAVLTVSMQGVKASDLKTLADIGWAGFPTPEPTPVPVAIGKPSASSKPSTAK